MKWSWIASVSSVFSTTSLWVVTHLTPISRGLALPRPSRYEGEHKHRDERDTRDCRRQVQSLRKENQGDDRDAQRDRG